MVGIEFAKGMAEAYLEFLGLLIPFLNRNSAWAKERMSSIFKDNMCFCCANETVPLGCDTSKQQYSFVLGVDNQRATFVEVCFQTVCYTATIYIYENFIFPFGALVALKESK